MDNSFEEQPPSEKPKLANEGIDLIQPPFRINTKWYFAAEVIINLASFAFTMTFFLMSVGHAARGGIWIFRILALVTNVVALAVPRRFVGPRLVKNNPSPWHRRVTHVLATMSIQILVLNLALICLDKVLLENRCGQFWWIFPTPDDWKIRKKYRLGV